MTREFESTRKTESITSAPATTDEHVTRARDNDACSGVLDLIRRNLDMLEAHIGLVDLDRIHNNAAQQFSDRLRTERSASSIKTTQELIRREVCGKLADLLARELDRNLRSIVVNTANLVIRQKLYRFANLQLIDREFVESAFDEMLAQVVRKFEIGNPPKYVKPYLVRGIYLMAVNELKSHPILHVEFSEETLGVHAANATTIEQLLANVFDTEFSALSAAISRLSSEERAVVVAKLTGQAHVEFASKSGLSAGTARQRYRRAINKLKADPGVEAICRARDGGPPKPP